VGEGWVGAPVGAFAHAGGVELEAVGVGDVEGDGGVESGEEAVVEALFGGEDAVFWV